MQILGIQRPRTSLIVFCLLYLPLMLGVISSIPRGFAGGLAFLALLFAFGPLILAFAIPALVVRKEVVHRVASELAWNRVFVQAWLWIVLTLQLIVGSIHVLWAWACVLDLCKSP